MTEKKQEVPKKGHLNPSIPEPTPPKEIFEPKENKTTLDQRIDSLIKNCHDNTQDLKSGIKDLIQRVTFPQEFCPSCDDKMFYQQDKRSYRCINCGYDSQQVSQERASAVGSDKPMPAAVSRAIENAGQATRDPRRIPPKIKPKVSQVDEEMVRQDPNVKGDVNWS